VLILTQDWCTVSTERTIGLKIIFDAPDGLLGDLGHVESRFDPFADNAILDARWCTVCAKCTTGSEIILDGPDVTPR
jgi:hypothetical protein